MGGVVSGFPSNLGQMPHTEQSNLTQSERWISTGDVGMFQTKSNYKLRVGSNMASGNRCAPGHATPAHRRQAAQAPGCTGVQQSWKGLQDQQRNLNQWVSLRFSENWPNFSQCSITEFFQAILTGIQWIFPESLTLTDLNLACCHQVQRT